MCSLRLILSTTQIWTLKAIGIYVMRNWAAHCVGGLHQTNFPLLIGRLIQQGQRLCRPIQTAHVCAPWVWGFCKVSQQVVRLVAVDCWALDLRHYCLVCRMVWFILLRNNQTNKQTNNTFSKFLLLFREVVKLGPSMGYCCCWWECYCSSMVVFVSSVRCCYCFCWLLSAVAIVYFIALVLEMSCVVNAIKFTLSFIIGQAKHTHTVPTWSSSEMRVPIRSFIACEYCTLHTNGLGHCVRYTWWALQYAHVVWFVFWVQSSCTDPSASLRTPRTGPEGVITSLTLLSIQ